MYEIKNRTISGLTLVETLVYIGLFALVVGGGLATAFGIIESQNNISVQASRINDIRFAESKIEWALSNSTRIIAPDVSTSTDLLWVEHGTEDIIFSLDLEGNLQIDREGEIAVINSNDTAFSDIEVWHRAPSTTTPRYIDVVLITDDDYVSTTTSYFNF